MSLQSSADLGFDIDFDTNFIDDISPIIYDLAVEPYMATLADGPDVDGPTLVDFQIQNPYVNNSDGSVPASDLGVRFKLDDENGIYTGIAKWEKNVFDANGALVSQVNYSTGFNANPMAGSYVTPDGQGFYNVTSWGGDIPHSTVSSDPNGDYKGEFD